MKILTHKLMRLSMVNWYLFSREDVNINGQDLMLTGRNGSGKSTILDAIQTVLSGADENKLMFNAASSDGKRSGRTIRSYVLGEVAESGGDGVKVEPRQASNSYLSMSFNDRAGKTYSFGCAFYARLDRPSVDKYFFIVRGTDLSSLDFMLDDNVVLPFKGFEKRLSAMEGNVTICSSASEFRARCCDLMSATGSSNAIQPDALFRAVSQGLKFKPQKDVTGFIKSHILPPQNIEVLQIENDFKHYKSIESEIEMAEERLGLLKRVVASYQKFYNKSKRATGFRWAEAEAKFCAADTENQNNKESLEEKNEELKIKSKRRLECIENRTTLHQNLVEAESLKNGSESTASISAFEKDKVGLEYKISQYGNIIEKCRKQLSVLEAIPVSGLSPELGERLTKLKMELAKRTDFESEDLTNRWPRSVENLEDTFNSLGGLQSIISKLTTGYEELRQDVAEDEGHRDSLIKTHAELSAGNASLKPQTEIVIKLLKSEGFYPQPICDLAEVKEEEWQNGIERFLGVWNREALLIVDSSGDEVSDSELERAMALYRKAMTSNPSLRSVKLLNPSRIEGSHNPASKGMAAELIESENLTVLKYLQSLLANVELVRTESELRRSRRAITPDGMTSGNGTISGGNRIDFLLFGKKARQEQAERLHLELTQLLTNISVNVDVRDRYKGALDSVRQSVTSIEAIRHEAIDGYACEAEQVEEIKAIDVRILILRSNPDYEQLEERYNKAFTEHEDNQNELEILATKIGALQSQIDGLNLALPNLERLAKAADKERHNIEHTEFFVRELANESFDGLAEAHNENYELIEKQARIKEGDRQSEATNAREEAKKTLVELCNKHDLEDKDELIELEPMKALERCSEYVQAIESSEIIGHRQRATEAKEMMLVHFRSEVAAKLKENMLQLETTFKTLNRSLKDLSFNNCHFRFTNAMVEVESLKDVYDYIMLPDETDTSGGLFDDTHDHPGMKVIEEVITDGRLSEVSDYRNFYSYDIVTTDQETGSSRRFSDLLSVGSGGEQQSPFYVALGASFMNAYRLTKSGDRGVTGGASLAIFDEAMSKMDGVNTSAALNFFKSLGLQVILAAPPEASIKIAPYVDKTITVIKAGTTVYLDEYQYSEESVALLESDNPMIHPELADAYVEGVKKEFGVE